MKSRHIQRIICPCPKFFLKSPQNNKRKQVQTFFKGQRINTTHMTLFIVVFTMSTRIDLYKKVKNYKGLNVLPSQTQLALGVLVVEVVVVGRHSVSRSNNIELFWRPQTRLCATTTLEAVLVVVRESRFCLCKGRFEGSEWRRPPLQPQLYSSHWSYQDTTTRLLRPAVHCCTPLL